MLKNNLSRAHDRVGWRKAKPAGARLWGDGLVDQSLTMLYYPCSWDDVTEDELAFLLPSLCRRQTVATDGDVGPYHFLRRALVARIYDCGLRLAGHAQTDSTHEWPGTIDTIDQSGVVTSVPPRRAWIEGEAVWRELYGGTPFIHQPMKPSAGGVLDELQRAVWIFELSVLACLDRVLGDAATSPGHVLSGGPGDITLADALTASIYSSFNAAYVYPQFEGIHELLTVGAWLGYPVRGRTALMPLLVAERLIDHLGGGSPDEFTDSGRCEALIRFHAGLAGGAARLLRMAKRVCSTGHPSVIRPDRLAGPSRPQPYVWNCPLAHLIAMRIGFHS